MKAKAHALSAMVMVVVFLSAAGTLSAGEQVVCFGDSYTASPALVSPPDYLEFFIDPGDGEVVNEGEGGETTDEGFWRIAWLLSTFHYWDADVWTYLEGGNDLKAWIMDVDPLMVFDPTSPTYPYQQELQDELDRIKFNIGMSVDLIRSTGAEVVLGTYMDVVPFLPCDPSPIGFFTPGLAAKANLYNDILNEAIREVATDKGVSVNDMAVNLPWISGHIVNYYDCLHPNTVGNFTIALSWWLAVMPYL